MSPANTTLSTIKTPHPAGDETLTRGASSLYREASPGQVRQWLSTGEAVLIDVREPDEHAREHIAGASLVSLSRFDPARIAALAQPGQKIVMHCRGGARSEDACRQAATLAMVGFQVFTMAGGIEAWKRSALPVETNSRVSRLSVMRQVQLVIGVGVLIGASLAWLVSPAFIAISAFFGAGLVFAGASGTCALASLIGIMPWNKHAASAGSCHTGRCT